MFEGLFQPMHLLVITARWMWRNLRYSILAIFVVSAMVTPTTDILNMCLFAAPMVALYAVSIGVCLAGEFGTRAPHRRRLVCANDHRRERGNGVP